MQRKPPEKMKDAVSKLAGELRFVRAEKQGVGANQESISAKLTAALQGLNSCAHQVDLNIDSITVTPKQITLNGDTSSRHSTVNTVQDRRLIFIGERGPARRARRLYLYAAAAAVHEGIIRAN
jgi:hypothetical protein